MDAIELDQLLRELTPEQKEHISQQFSTAWKDQADAAHQEALDLIVDIHGARDIAPVGEDNVPGWLRWGALDAFLQWMKGGAKTCSHVMNWRSPMPVMAVAWKPGYVACEYCAGPLFKVYGDADKTCDGCGHICDVDNGDLIATSTIIIGSFTYQAGVCMDCDTAPDVDGMDGNHRTSVIR